MVRFILAFRLMNFMLNRSNRYRLYSIPTTTYAHIPSAHLLIRLRIIAFNPSDDVCVPMFQCWEITFHKIKCSRCYLKLKITNQGHLILFIYCNVSRFSRLLSIERHIPIRIENENGSKELIRRFCSFFHGIPMFAVKKKVRFNWKSSAYNLIQMRPSIRMILIHATDNVHQDLIENKWKYCISRCIFFETSTHDFNARLV